MNATQWFLWAIYTVTTVAASWGKFDRVTVWRLGLATMVYAAANALAARP